MLSAVQVLPPVPLMPLRNPYASIGPAQLPTDFIDDTVSDDPTIWRYDQKRNADSDRKWSFEKTEMTSSRAKDLLQSVSRITSGSKGQ